MTDFSKATAVVLGGYVNSLSLVRELAPGRMPVWVLDCQHNAAHWSRYATRGFVRAYLNDDKAFIEALCELGEQMNGKGVLFPTHDYHVKMMAENKELLSRYYHVQINPDSAMKIISKQWQYELCDRIGVPHPQTVYCNNPDQAAAFTDMAKNLQFPLLLKPFSRASDAYRGDAFRAERVDNIQELKALFDSIPRLREGRFLASEIIPGGPENIWAFTGYCDSPGHVMAGWTGRKLTQRPRDFGVFSTAETRMDETVDRQGRALLEASEHLGIGEPEFKYDARDGKYKLTEINPRAMMWHIVGYFGGVNLPLIQYYHLTGDAEACRKLCVAQNPRPKRLVFMTFELMNILDHRPKLAYIKSAIRSLFLRRKRFAIFWINDPLPWVQHVCFFVRKFFSKIIRGKNHAEPLQ